MKKHAAVIETKKGGDFWKESRVSFYRDEKNTERSLLCIYPDTAYQKWEGFGGALTESVAHNLCRMGTQKQQEVLKAYFSDDEGIGLNFCRVNIGSCDFSTETYSYCDVPDDFALKTFSLEHDERELIPMIREALKTAPELKILSSPWSPPAWMKTNHDLEHGGSLRPECRKVWADYLARYVREYERRGISIWGITVQNEAMASQPWESCVYTAEEERDFVKDFLGPAFCQEGLEKVKLLIWDHNKERVVERVRTAMEDKEAAAYIYGAAVHWYSGDHFDALSLVHEQYPGLRLFSTENSMGRYPKHFWEMGEKIAHGIIGEMKNYVTAWFIWNLILDENGLPNHDHPIGRSPMMVDFSENGRLYYDSAYYYLGHFSKFIRPGAVRIPSSIYTDKLETVTFRNPDGNMATVILNRTGEEMPVILRCRGMLADLISAPRSILTVCYSL